MSLQGVHSLSLRGPWETLSRHHPTRPRLLPRWFPSHPPPARLSSFISLPLRLELTIALIYCCDHFPPRKTIFLCFSSSCLFVPVSRLVFLPNPNPCSPSFYLPAPLFTTCWETRFFYLTSLLSSFESSDVSRSPFMQENYLAPFAQACERKPGGPGREAASLNK